MDKLIKHLSKKYNLSEFKIELIIKSQFGLLKKIIERIITPEKKMLLIFPSEVFHYTGQNDTKEERISISGNFDMQQKEQKKE